MNKDTFRFRNQPKKRSTAQQNNLAKGRAAAAAQYSATDSSSSQANKHASKENFLQQQIVELETQVKEAEESAERLKTHGDSYQSGLYNEKKKSGRAKEAKKKLEKQKKEITSSLKEKTRCEKDEARVL
ncbi:hypothetical protein BT96DRAFT_1006393 [Gymnopus androsaceus JB14]|uniref:Uncharacterized protein n=1 Tax=Gymnopus androsaceus JB14 TaxID=1447944 RepID=A0A6A4GKF9_9AGAR|nr:hypothetical protein BT96DRAFT_1006393 [Gymnopus androsaceus JB14]